MNTTVIDKLGTPLNTTFGELESMDFFQDTDNNICVKVGNDKKLIWRGDCWKHYPHIGNDELVLPLKATITLERGE